ncbi:SRPBCC domain-containing protein [Streptomyces sp. HMX87]|uniref:SRPBCC domain-containing protein n=1 Tax=Streptomyces sp. HMX87 TaxID=3390849 RepID=UPI003A84C247
MEHEVFVPVPAERLREVLADPARVAGAVPGLQQDAGAEPVAGRLKMRVGGHSITYRGSARLSARQDGAYTVEGEGAEARGSGKATFELTVRLRDAEGGAALAFDGTATADGRVTELPQDAVASAVHRLLTRFAENLAAAQAAQAEQAEQSGRATPDAASVESQATEDFEPTATGDLDAAPDADDAPAPPASPAEPSEPAGPSEPAESSPAPPASPASPVFDADVPPSSLDATADEAPSNESSAEPPAESSAEPPAESSDGPIAEPPAEAAHARRTMIGRSAEEVDHAPPRGRYAPVPAPQSTTPGTPLRWAAPAAALVVASAIVVGRALRRRR